MTDNQPIRKPMTLAELRMKTAKAEKETTTFVKTPTMDIAPGAEFLFRVDQVIEGQFDTPMVIASEVRMATAKGTFEQTALKGYVQDGLTGPREQRLIGPGEKARIPPFIIRRGMTTVDFHAKLVYYAKYIGDKEVSTGTFRNGVVILVGSDFPSE